MCLPVHGQRTPSSAVHICRTFAPREPAQVKVSFGWVGSSVEVDWSAEGTIVKLQGPWRIESAVVAAEVNPVGVGAAWRSKDWRS
jgi:hypothetical protein